MTMSVRFDKVSKSFANNAVLSDVDLLLEDNRIYILSGASGSGKTTLFRLIASLDTPDKGTVTTEGTVSYAFQETRLFPQLTVRENIALLDPAASPDKILIELNLSDAAKKYPHELSGGMKKRAELARALSVRASAYLLDEPTAGLDTAHAAMVADAIRAYTSGATVIVATHDQTFANALSTSQITIEDKQVKAVL